MTQHPPPGNPTERRTSDRPTEPPPVASARPGGPLPDDRTRADDPVAKRSRFGELWVGLIVAAVILVLLLIFVVQNSQTVQVDYFGLSGHLPLAVAILLGVAAGALLVALPGTVRIIQLRKAARRSSSRTSSPAAP